MIPFSLRWLHALLPSFLSCQNDSIDSLDVLLNFVRSRIGEGLSEEVWRSRESFVLSTIICQQSKRREFVVCFDFINEMLSKDVDNLILISMLGYVQFGDLEGTKSSFQKVEDVMRKEGEEGLSVEFLDLVGRNKALIYVVAKDYVSAVREYDECIERDGSNVVAINNNLTRHYA